MRFGIHRIASAPRGAIGALVELFYPTICGLCQARLAVNEAIVCDPCRGALSPDYQWRCAQCGGLGFGERSTALIEECPRCPAPDAPYRGALWVTPYNEISGPVVRGFKYHRRGELGELMADMMAVRLAEPIAALREAPEPADRPEWIVPVPLHWRRNWSRGFNQSATLAARLARTTGLELTLALRRIRHTRPQALVPRDRRAANIAGAFTIRKEIARPVPSCILVDDVMTSGHTAAECARALREAGAPQVWIACFARG